MANEDYGSMYTFLCSSSVSDMLPQTTRTNIPCEGREDHAKAGLPPKAASAVLPHVQTTVTHSQIVEFLYLGSPWEASPRP